jgi:hypothetical protein
MTIKVKKGINEKANYSAGTENIPSKTIFSRLHLDIELLLGLYIKRNTLRMMICTEIIFFYDQELRRRYFLTIRYLKIKAQ